MQDSPKFGIVCDAVLSAFYNNLKTECVRLDQ